MVLIARSRSNSTSNMKKYWKRAICAIIAFTVANFNYAGRCGIRQNKLICMGFNYVILKTILILLPWRLPNWRLRFALFKELESTIFFIILSVSRAQPFLPNH